MAKTYSDHAMTQLIGDGTFRLKERIRIAVMTEAGRPWPTYDGKQLDRSEYVTASEASKCVRQLSFEKHAHKATVQIPDYWENMSDEEFKARLLAMHDDDMRGIFARGNWMEEWVVDRLYDTEQEDELFLCLGKDQRSFYTDKKKVSGTPDGLIVFPDKMEWRGLEFKSSQNPVSAAREAHVNQLNVNMGLINSLATSGVLDEHLGVNISDMKLTGGNLLYVDSSNYLTMYEEKIEYDQGEAYARACAKAKALFVKDGNVVALRQPHQLVPEGLEKWNGCSFCSYKSQCKAIEDERHHKETSAKLQKILDAKKADAPVQEMPVFKADTPRAKIAAALVHYDLASRHEKQADKEKKEIKAAISDWVAAQKGRKAKFTEDGMEFSVSLTETTRSGGLDKEALAEVLEQHGLKIEDYQKPDAVFDTFLVSVKYVAKDV